MDALAQEWSRSGRKPDPLQKQSRRDHQGAQSLDYRPQSQKPSYYKTNDTIFSLGDEYGNLADIRITPFKAKHVKNVERVKVRKLSLVHYTRC